MGLFFKLRARRRLWADSASFLRAEWSRRLRKHRSWPLPGRGRRVRVRVAGLDAPIWARMGTSDFLVIADLLGGQDAGGGHGAADGRGEYDAAMDAAERSAGGRDGVGMVLDLGANIGVATVMLAERFPLARVIAVEPDAENFELLRLNTEHLGGRVRRVRAFAGASRRTAGLDRRAHGGEPWAVRMESGAAGGGEQVAVERIEDLAGEEPATIDLLKCDIEGGEKELFESCGGWIGRVRAAVVELHEPYGREEFLARVRAGLGPGAAMRDTVLKADPWIQVILLQRDGGGA